MRDFTKPVVVVSKCMETFGIYDKQIVIIGCTPRQDYARTEALWAKNDSVVRIVQHYFNYMWKEAEPART